MGQTSRRQAKTGATGARSQATAARGKTPGSRTGSTTQARQWTWWQGPWLIVGSLAVVALAVGLFAAFGRGQSGPPLPSQAEFAPVVQATTHVSEQVSAAVGTGGLPNPLKPTGSNTPLTGASSKPQVLYIGADYCPYCAGERWSLVVALSRFGSFSDLKPTLSASNDVYPNTPTFSFHGSKFTSSYVDFQAVETETRDQKPLEQPTAQQQRLMSQFDPSGSIPFIDVGNQFIGIGSGYQIDVLQGKDWQQISQALSDPASPITRAIVGDANYLTAAICRSTNGQPGSVCSAPAIQSTGI